jgi:signal transduction histidine kinase/ActR/RegA family two-component response regulator
MTSQGEATLTAVSPVAGLPWGIYVLAPASEAFAPVDAMTRQARIAIAVAVVLTGLGAMSLALWLTRPLLRLRAVVNAVARGELGRRMGSHRRDEIGQLGSAFDAMADQLQQTLAERTRLANAVERERATLAAVLASMTDGLLVLDRGGRIVYANDPAGQLLGVDPHALLGKNTVEWVALLGPSLHEPRATLAAWEQACARSQERPTFDMLVAAPMQRDLRAQCFPVTDGKRRRTGVLLHDVTAERELVRTRRELTSMVSHELASPATNLVAYAETLADPDVPEAERPEMLAAMVKEGQRLVSIVQDFLDIQRLEHARLQIHLQTTDLRTLLEHAAKVARADAAHPVVLEIPEALPLVEVDPNRIQQVLANLVSNAQKYTPSGGQLRLAARVLGQTVEVSVADTGLGIPAEALPRLFDKFYRVETTDRRSIRGTGLGLAIAKELIEANGGQIGAESAGPGLGSRFWFTVPVASGTESNPVQARLTEHDGGDQSMDTPVRAARPMHILAVDDDAMIRNALTRLLRLEGHAVRTADSGEDALVQLRRHTFDVVISDLGLAAGMSGFQLAGEVRRSWPTVRFILATGSVGTEPAEAQAHGADALLIKPYRPGELRGLLQQFQQSGEQEAAA